MSGQFIQLGPFFDQGVICGAAQLEHYEAGTSALKHIYSDVSMTTALPQPFVSDANGIFNFYGSGYYQFVIKRADGAILHTVDNWKILDQAQQGLGSGAPVSTGSSMDLEGAVWAHWTGSTNVQTLTGSALFYWAMADGNFTLIHSASLILPDSRNRKVNSGDVLFFINEGSGVFRLGGHMEKEGGWKGRQAVTVAATSTLSVPTDGDLIDVSGGTSITGIGIASPGYRFIARFTGTGLNIIANATTMKTPWGTDYRTVQNELIQFISLGSGNWIMHSLNGPKEQTGQIVSTGDPSGAVGCVPCDGAALSRTTYSGLFQKIGSTYGAGDGSTTFNAPDDRGRFELMVDGAANRITSASVGGANADTIGGTGGAQTHTLLTAEMPSHTHTMDGSGTVGASTGFAFSTAPTGTKTSNATGGDGAHNNMPPWIARNRFIRF